MNNPKLTQPIWSEMWKGIASPELCHALESLAVTKKLLHDELLYATGDVGNELYGVKSGAIRLIGLTAEGNQAIAGLHIAGSWFGEISLFDNLPRPVNAYAIGDTEIYIVCANKVQKLLDDNPHWYKDFIQILCYKLRLSLSYLSAALLPVSARIALRLLDLAQVYGKTLSSGTLLDLKLTQDDLAHMLQMTRQTININMRVLEREQLILRQQGKIILPNIIALKQHIYDNGGEKIA
jgi:CRP/FNR family transcriptional regulator, cyclic AMP receptor protein